MVISFPTAGILLLLLLAGFVQTSETSAESHASIGSFFEAKVRPILETHCLDCHNERKQRSRLRLDSLDAIRAGGKRFGAAIIPGNIQASPLLRAVRWETEEDFHMPPDEKLQPELIADLEQWVAMLANPPESGPPLVGRIHPIVVHLPIACLILAALAEILVLWRGALWRPTTAFLVLIGTCGSIAAVISGLNLEGTQDRDLLERHELLAWLTLAGALIASGLLVLERWVPMRRWLLIAVLLLTAVLVAMTGHVGGQMAWGRDWLPF